MNELSLRNISIGLVVFLIGWTLLSIAVQLPVIPSPYLVAMNLKDIFGTVILEHVLASVLRIFIGVLLAVLVAVPLGTAMGYYPAVNRFFSPLVYLSYPIPKVALLPIVMLIFGIGETAKILLIFLIVVYQVVIAVRDGILAVPEEMFLPLYSLGASFADIFQHLLFPAVLPKFFTALRVAMATAVSVLFFTETFGTDYGIGYFIMDAWLRVDYLEMYSGIVVLSCLGFIIFLAIDGMERKLCCWQYK